jgi:hypothetical protein
MWPPGPSTSRLPHPIPLEEMQTPKDATARVRSFKDVACGLLFFLVFALCSGTIAVAFSYGEPSTLLGIAPSWLGTIETEVDEFFLGEVAILLHDFKAVICALLAAMVLALLWFQLFKHLTQMMVYFTLAMAIALTTALGIYLFTVSRRTGNGNFIFLAILCWLIAFATLLVGYVLRGKITFTGAIIYEAGRALQANPAILAVTVIIILVYAVFCVVWVAAFIYLYSVPAGFVMTEFSGFTEIFNRNYQNLFWILVVGGCWILPTIYAVEEYIISSITIQHLEIEWGLRSRTTNIAMQATGEAFTTQFGSLALGAALTGLAYLLSVLSKWIWTRENFPFRDNCCVGFIVRFSRFLIEIVSDFAFIYVAASGESFVTSARKVMRLLNADISETIVLEVILSYLLFVGQLLGTTVITLSTIVIIEMTHVHVGTVTVVVISLTTFFLFTVVSRAILVCSNTLLVFVLQDIHDHLDDLKFDSPEHLRNIIITKFIQRDK